MWLQEWERWCRGAVTFRAEGGLCERFLNLLTRGEAAVPLWHVVRTPHAVTATMRAADYAAVRPAARRTGTRVRLVDKKGLPFCARPLMKRPGLLVGVLFALVLYTALASRVWVINVHTDDPVAAEEVKACLAANGVTLGKKMNDVDLAAVQLQSIADLKNLHRLSLYFDGSIAHVDVQWDTAGVSVPDTTPANIVAAHDGRIVAMQVTSGQSMVKAGEAVVAGDLLVSGAVETTAGVLLRHAAARVLAQTTHTFEETVPLCEPLKQDGHSFVQSALRLLSLEIPLYSHVTPDASYTCRTQERMLTLRGIALPVGIVSRVYTQTRTVMTPHTREEAELLARERLTARAEAALAATTVEDVTFEGVWEQDVYRLRAVYTCTEDIAKTTPLLVAP